MQYPATELEYWSAFFSINDNQDKPSIPERVPTPKEAEEQLKRVLFMANS